MIEAAKRVLRLFQGPVLATLSAVLLALPFCWDALWPVAYFAFLPFFYALRRKASSQIFRISALFGLVFFLIESYPVIYVTVVGYLALVSTLALYFALFGYLARPCLLIQAETGKMYYRGSLKAVCFVPAIWVFLEYARSFLFSGMPWGLLAYSQGKNLVGIQIADMVGAFGVSFFVMFVNVALFKIQEAYFFDGAPEEVGFDRRRERRRYLLQLTGALGLGILLVGAYGGITLALRENVAPQRVLRAAVVQGNIPQDQKWDTRIKNIIFEKYKRLTFMAALEKPDLVVWPETSFPGYLEDEPILAAKLRSLVRHSGTRVLVGAPTLGNLDQGLRFYNSAMLFGADGEERARYSKIRLVPFGEFLPFEPLLGFMRRLVPIPHFSPGREKVLFELIGLGQKKNERAKFAVLICYEDIFPELVGSFCHNGADFLVNITNDAWFGPTSAPYQHAQASVFRAVENRVPVIRAGNTGLSCFISPEGRILSRVQDKGQDIFVTGYKAQELSLRKTTTLYTRFGHFFFLVPAFLCFLAYQDNAKRHPYSKL